MKIVIKGFSAATAVAAWIMFLGTGELPALAIAVGGYGLLLVCYLQEEDAV